MATKIVMPKLGMAMKEGQVAKWVKNSGDAVSPEDPIVVVMSKKITFEVKAPVAGVVHAHVEAKQMRPVGALIGWILEPGEAVPEGGDDIEEVEVTEVGAAPAPAAAKTPAAQPAPAAKKGGFVPASPAARRMAKDKGIDLGDVTGSGPGGRVTESDVEQYEAAQAAKAAEQPLATSAAKWLAQDKGIDLSQVQGSGPGGRITEADVERAAAPSPAPAAAAQSVPYSGMRQMIGEHMLRSLQETAQVTVTHEIDATELVKLRGQLKADYNPTFTDLLIIAVAKTLKKHPRVNCTLVGDEIQLLSDIHLGVAVALDEGLIVPVVRHADRLSLPAVVQETARLAAGARDGSLGVDEVTGSTFTITNLGSYGTDAFTPIINAPEAAILGVGRIVQKPWVHEGEIAIRSMMMLSLTIDHRLLDGAPGAAFLRDLGLMLSNPYRILV